MTNQERFNLCLAGAAKRVEAVKGEYPNCVGMMCAGGGVSRTHTIPGTSPFEAGYCKITTDPSNGTWRVLGCGNPSWFNSGGLLPLLCGNYTIEFGPVSTWQTPVPISVEILKELTTEVSVVYSKMGECPDPQVLGQPMGTQVTADTFWSGSYPLTRLLVSTSSLLNGGTTTIYCQSGSSTWVALPAAYINASTPCNLTYRFGVSSSLFDSGSHIAEIKVGSLNPYGKLHVLLRDSVTLAPIAATWNVCNNVVKSNRTNDIPCNNKILLNTGSYTIHFNPLDAMTLTPSTESITINSGSITKVTGSYVVTG